MALPKGILALPLAPEAMERIARGCEATSVAGQPRDQVLAQLGDAEGLLCSALFPIDSALFKAAPKLRVIANVGVGYNNVNPDEATSYGVAVCNTPSVLTDAVADVAIGLILNASRHLVDHANYVRRGGWSRREPQPALGFDLHGKTLGIIGYGRIGRATAHRARAFGLRILFHDVFVDPGPGDDARYRSLDNLLRESDIVSLHTNLTPRTNHLIGARELGLMKKTAWVINTSRGPVIDEEALVAALHAGTIAGAGLDVTEVEPLPEGAPLLSAPNTIVLPHMASGTVETRAAMLDLAMTNFLSVLGRQRPPACVNPEVLDRALSR
jgi:glyoxylate reductase